MDVLSHGFWGAIAFGRRARSHFWLAFVFGVAPDVFSFGVLYAAALFGLAEYPDFSRGTPSESSIPSYVHHLYNITHSLVVFIVVFLVVWALKRRPVWQMAAWGLHVLMDIPTHSFAFFPTPVFWPLSNWKFDGWQWMTPLVLVPNIVLLITVYTWFFLGKRLRRFRRSPGKAARSDNASFKS